MFPDKAKKIISAPIPEYLIKERDGGGKKKLSYISGVVVIDMLNTAFDYNWDWIVDSQWITESRPRFNKWAKVPESEKVTHNGDKGAWESQAPVAHVKGVLTVKFKNSQGELVSISKTGYGSKVILGGASEQDSIFKSAGTDALKKAASLLGIGGQLYRDDVEEYYYQEINTEDPWTDELLEQYKEERTFIKNFMSEFELDEESTVGLLQEFDEDIGNLGDIVPDNIQEVVAFINKKIEEAQEGEE